MQKNDATKKEVSDATNRVVELEAELENAAEVHVADDSVAVARAALHEWVDSVVGVVSSPGVGRVSLIHSNGKESRISSSELPYLLSRPARFE